MRSKSSQVSKGAPLAYIYLHTLVHTVKSRDGATVETMNGKMEVLHTASAIQAIQERSMFKGAPWPTSTSTNLCIIPSTIKKQSYEFTFVRIERWKELASMESP